MASARPKTNPLLPLGALSIVAMVFGGLWLLQANGADQGVRAAQASQGLVPESIDADSPNETIRSLRGDALRISKENERLIAGSS